MSARDTAVAVIGMAARLPGASSVDAYWANLRGGVESVTFFSEADLVGRGIDPDLVAGPD
jgi:acyl transferase domain-containing protein